MPAAHVHALPFQVVIEIVVRVEVGREHHATEVLVVAVDELVIQVADDRIGEPRLDPLDQVLAVDRALHPVFPERHERDGDDAALVLLVPLDGDRVGARRQRRLEAAVRREPDLELPLLGQRRLRHDVVPSTFQARLPLTIQFRRCSPTIGVVMIGALPPPIGPPWPALV